jgi:hypothetical protein
MNEVKVGSYTGNAAAQNIELGFVPGLLMIFNITDGTNFSVWTPALAAGAGISVVTTAGPVLDATNQVTRFDGVAGVSAPGFTVGTDLSANAKVYNYIAFRAAHPRTEPATAGAQTGTSA